MKMEFSSFVSSKDSSQERVLVEAAQSDPAKFDALYELQFERVYAFVATRVRNRATAEQLTSQSAGELAGL